MIIDHFHSSLLHNLSEESKGAALDVLQVLVQHSPKPLSMILINTAFPAACHCILNSEDNGTLQSVGEVIRTYLSVSPQQVIDYTDNEGRTGLRYIFQIIAQLLNPQVIIITMLLLTKLFLAYKMWLNPFTVQ